MKKLLSILGSFTLASSSTIMVVSCGPKKNDPSVNQEQKNDYLNLILEFKKEVGEIVYGYFSKNEVQKSLVAFSGNSNNLTFFNIENIKKYGKTEDTSSFLKDQITPEIEDEIFNNLSSVLDLSKLTSEINSLGSETSKYNIILDSKFLDQNTYLKGSTSINYTTKSYEGAEISDEWLLSYTSLTIETIVKYKDQDNSVQNYTISVPIVFTWATDEVLISKVQKIQNDVLKDYYAENTYSWLDINTTELGYKKQTSYEIFELFDETKRTIKFKEVYKGEEFQKEFISFIKKEYLKEGPFNSLKVNFKKSNDIDYDYKNTLKEKLKTSNFKAFDNKSEEYSSARHDILTKLEENGSQVNFREYGVRSKNDTIYNILNNDSEIGLSKQFEVYKKTFDEFNNKNEYKGVYANSYSFMHGTISIDNLQIAINDTFDLPFNTFDIAYSVSVDKEEKSIDNVSASIVGNTSLGNAVYLNTIKGIQSFQNVFNTKAPTINNGSGNNKFLTPIAFVGKNDSLAKNIWDYISKDSVTNTKDVNDVLSLNIDDLISHRIKLLYEGYQNDFDFNIRNFWKKGESGLPWIGGKDAYLYASLNKDNEGFKIREQYKGYENRFVSIKLEINFVTLFFVINQSGDSGIKLLNSYIIERAK